MINYIIQKHFEKIFAKSVVKKLKIIDPPNVGEFRIQFPLQKFYENEIISTPFTMSVQSLNSQFEIKMPKKYPELLTATFYDDRLLKMFYEMQAEVRKQLTAEDRLSIESYFYKKMWFNPFVNFRERFIYFEHLDYKLITWREKPALRINGIIHIDFKRMLREYYSNYIFTNTKKQFLKENFRITFNRRFPTILTYMKEVELRDMIVKIISTDLASLEKKKLVVIPNNLIWTQLLVNRLGRVEKYSKVVEWINPTTLQVKIADYFSKLIDKVKQNSGKIIVGGVILGGVLNHRKITKELEKKLNGR